MGWISWLWKYNILENSFIVKVILTLILSTIILANENWIKIEPINKTQTPKSKSKLDVNLSQIEPVNKIMKNATAIKQLIDATSKKEKKTTNNKNWFVINGKEKKWYYWPFSANIHRLLLFRI